MEGKVTSGGWLVKRRKDYRDQETKGLRDEETKGEEVGKWECGEVAVVSGQ